MLQKDEFGLRRGEIFWRDNYYFLLRRGYMLRPRYHPDWVGSWVGTNEDPLDCEDSIMGGVSGLAMYLSTFLNIR